MDFWGDSNHPYIDGTGIAVRTKVILHARTGRYGYGEPKNVHLYLGAKTVPTSTGRTNHLVSNCAV